MNIFHNRFRVKPPERFELTAEEIAFAEANALARQQAWEIHAEVRERHGAVVDHLDHWTLMFLALDKLDAIEARISKLEGQ